MGGLGRDTEGSHSDDSLARTRQSHRPRRDAGEDRDEGEGYERKARADILAVQLSGPDFPAYCVTAAVDGASGVGRGTSNGEAQVRAGARAQVRCGRGQDVTNRTVGRGGTKRKRRSTFLWFCLHKRAKEGRGRKKKNRPA